MHVHNVYFWLNDDDPDASFEAGIASLTADPNVRYSHYGRPASTDRDVVENSYTYGAVLVFDDRTAHDKYQAGGAHLQFLEDHMERWDRAVVYDVET